jgi:hypothetical protein
MWRGLGKFNDSQGAVGYLEQHHSVSGMRKPSRSSRAGLAAFDSAASILEEMQQFHCIKVIKQFINRLLKITLPANLNPAVVSNGSPLSAKSGRRIYLTSSCCCHYHHSQCSRYRHSPSSTVFLKISMLDAVTLALLQSVPYRICFLGMNRAAGTYLR